MDRVSARLSKLADNMAAEIEAKRHPAIAEQNYTARRARIAANMAADADWQEMVQSALYGLASARERGRLHPFLRGVTSRALVEWLLRNDKYPNPKWDGQEAVNRVAKAGIGPDEHKVAHEQLAALVQVNDEERRRRDEQREAEAQWRRLVGVIPGFFPTPRKVIDEMFSIAYLRFDLRSCYHDSRTGYDYRPLVLDPSAGHGALLDAWMAYDYDRERLHAVECSWTLRKVLQKKGYRLVGDDFMSFEGNRLYDAMFMNPPFERGQDIEHVTRAYETCLKEGGVLVAVMSEGAFFRSDSKAVAFREMIGQTVNYVYKLPADAFKESGTGVQTRIVAMRR